MKRSKRSGVLALFYVVAICSLLVRGNKSVHFRVAKIKHFFTKPKIHLLLKAENLYS